MVHLNHSLMNLQLKIYFLFLMICYLFYHFLYLLLTLYPCYLAYKMVYYCFILNFIVANFCVLIQLFVNMYYDLNDFAKDMLLNLIQHHCRLTITKQNPMNYFFLSFQVIVKQFMFLNHTLFRQFFSILFGKTVKLREMGSVMFMKIL